MSAAHADRQTALTHAHLTNPTHISAALRPHCVPSAVTVWLNHLWETLPGSDPLSIVESVRAGGLEIAYERVGAGPPLVFVHGAADGSRIWQPQLAGLADEFTVVAWDEPGAGRSSDLPEGVELAGFADELAALIETIGLGPAHVAGLSWGGNVVLELYRRHPALVATLIMIDTYAGWKGSLPAGEVAAPVAGARRMLAAPHEHMDPTLPGLFAADPPPEFVPLLAAIAADVRPAMPGASWRSWPRPN